MRYEVKIVLAGMAAVAVAFYIVIEGVYLVHARYPEVPDEVFAPIAVGVLFGIAFGILWLLMGARLPNWALTKRIRQIKEEAAHKQADSRESRRLRVDALRADPARSRYAGLVERGEEWSDEQIAYNEDLSATATCPHLQPIELGMRLAGVTPKLIIRPWLENPAPLLRARADCCIDVLELKGRFPLPESVLYQEGYQPERHPEDNPWAQLSCSACGSAIDLTHSQWPRATTKWFPGKPA